MFVVLVTLYKCVYKVFNTILFASNCFARWKYWIERTEKKEIDNGDASLKFPARLNALLVDC